MLDAASKLHARAASVAAGLEPTVPIAVDAICPASLLIELGRAFQERFPSVALRIETDVLEAVPALVLDGRCHVGIAGPVGVDADGLDSRFLMHIPMVPVAAPWHPLAALPAHNHRLDLILTFPRRLDPGSHHPPRRTNRKAP